MICYCKNAAMNFVHMNKSSPGVELLGQRAHRFFAK